MKSHSGFLGALVRALLLLAFVSGGAMAPVVPARATTTYDLKLMDEQIKLKAMEAEKWRKALGFLGDIIDILDTLIDLINDWFDTVFGTKQDAAAAETAAQQGQIQGLTDAAQGLADSRLEDVHLRAVLRARARTTSPRTDYVAKQALVSQLPLTTKAFETRVAQMAAAAIETAYRGPKDDGAGVQASVQAIQAMALLGSGNPLDNPLGWVDASTKGTDGRSLADAHLSISTITGGQVLEVPTFEERKDGDQRYVTPIPDSNVPEQKFWIAGLYYCFNLAGIRPSPPYGRSMDTPSGRVARAQWNHCASQHSALIKPCTELLAHFSRPNKSMKDIIKQQSDKCEEAEGIGIVLPDSFKGATGEKGCSKGLSPYQALYLAHAMCKSDQYYISQAFAGGKDSKMVDQNIDCSTAWNLWKLNEVTRKVKVISAVSGILELQDCWKAVQYR